jgi:hypothetical protein
MCRRGELLADALRGGDGDGKAGVPGRCGGHGEALEVAWVADHSGSASLGATPAGRQRQAAVT